MLVERWCQRGPGEVQHEGEPRGVPILFRFRREGAGAESEGMHARGSGGELGSERWGGEVRRAAWGRAFTFEVCAVGDGSDISSRRVAWCQSGALRSKIAITKSHLILRRMAWSHGHRAEIEVEDDLITSDAPLDNVQFIGVTGLWTPHCDSECMRVFLFLLELGVCNK